MGVSGKCVRCSYTLLSAHYINNAGGMGLVILSFVEGGGKEEGDERRGGVEGRRK